jgi:hypothetical protein
VRQFYDLITEGSDDSVAFLKHGDKRLRTPVRVREEDKVVRRSIRIKTAGIHKHSGATT